MISSYLERKQERLERELQEAIQQMENLPEGELYFVRNRANWKWKCRWRTAVGQKKCAVLKKSDLTYAQKLAKRRYLAERAKGIQKLIRAIEQVVRAESDLVSYPEKLKEICEDYRDLLSASCERNREAIKAWKNESYRSNPDRQGQRLIPTKSGIYVRSKSEAIIADLLYDLGIPFRYEPELIIGKTVLYPDFLILNPITLEEVIWEHCGMMDDPSYAQKVFSRLGILYAGGYSFDKKNLICTYESKEHPLDVRYAQIQIEYYFPEVD